MSALARQCLNVFSPAIARRWTPASVPLRRLTTNNAPADDPLLWDKLLDTTNSPAVRKKLTGQSPDDAWLAQHKRTISSLVPPNNAYSGRSIAVKKDLTGTAVATAYSALASRIRKNKVRQDYTANMRHEKKGVKRRRLESERWRRRFADHVRQKVQLVKEIRRRGA